MFTISTINQQKIFEKCSPEKILAKNKNNDRKYP